MTSETPWHLLQLSDVLDREFASALAESTPVIAWQPQRTWLPWKRTAHAPTRTGALTIQPLPLMRGYARFPFSLLARTGTTVVKRLRAVTPDSRNAPLICTVPFFAPAAELWDGPVIYWLTDLIAEYSGAQGIDVPALDRQLCRSATLVCPNSERLRTYLLQQGCDPRKIVIVPNATRVTNVFSLLPTGPTPLPPAVASVPRPIAGVIGNLAGNMDWLLLDQTIAATPALSWVFVGPTGMEIPDAQQRKARERVLRHPRAHFTGPQAYGDLAAFARAFDVAVLPYLRCEPTYSGSSTRFYEHLAACRPMVATPGLEELNRKVPLLRLVETPGQMIQALHDLLASGFDDGLAKERWAASQQGTWQFRAQTMQAALRERRQTGQDTTLSGQRLRA